MDTRSGLPGAELIEAGLVDLERSVESVPALLVAIGAPRLRQLAIDPTAFARAVADIAREQ